MIIILYSNLFYLYVTFLLVLFTSIHIFILLVFAFVIKINISIKKYTVTVVFTLFGYRYILHTIRFTKKRRVNQFPYFSYPL